MAAAIFASMLTYTYIQGEPEKICRPSNQPVQLHVGTQPFDPHFPPLLSQGQKIVNQSQMVTWGEASLHVCSRGTAEQSFLRRDDCDGCMCPLGSLWMPYKDPRFFGNGEFCVPEKQWKDCISRWSCCKNKPNYCWDFIFDGARQDPKSQVSFNPKPSTLNVAGQDQKCKGSSALPSPLNPKVKILGPGPSHQSAACDVVQRGQG
jgi:hypothetical protein